MSELWVALVAGIVGALIWGVQHQRLALPGGRDNSLDALT
jgi:hypothetical protein